MRLIDVAINLPENVLHWRVKDLLEAGGNWNFDQLRHWIPPRVLQYFYASLPPHEDSESNYCFWPGGNMGRFSVSSAYHSLMGTSSLQMLDKWSKLWKMETIERIKTFGWQLMPVLTNSCKAMWGLGSAFCPHCRFFEECALHVLRDCLLVVPVWRHFNSDTGPFSFQELLNNGLI